MQRATNGRDRIRRPPSRPGRHGRGHRRRVRCSPGQSTGARGRRPRGDAAADGARCGTREGPCRAATTTPWLPSTRRAACASARPRCASLSTFATIRLTPPPCETATQALVDAGAHVVMANAGRVRAVARHHRTGRPAAGRQRDRPARSCSGQAHAVDGDRGRDIAESGGARARSGLGHAGGDRARGIARPARDQGGIAGTADLR